MIGFTRATPRVSPSPAARTGPVPEWLGPQRALVLLALYAVVRLWLDGPAPLAVLAALNTFTADLGAAWLAALGTPMWRDGVLLTNGRGFAVEVHATCTALLPVLLLSLAIALHPSARVADKLSGILLGAMVVVLVNQARLVGVIWVGVHVPALFDSVHGVLAPVLLVALTSGYAAVWARVAASVRMAQQ